MPRLLRESFLNRKAPGEIEIDANSDGVIDKEEHFTFQTVSNLKGARDRTVSYAQAHQLLNRAVDIDTAKVLFSTGVHLL